MTAEQGADERRIQTLLHRLGVGPDADPQPTTPPTPHDDWWDRLYTDEPKPDPAKAVGGGRLPDWRTGGVDLDTPAAPEDEPQEEPADTSPDTDPDESANDPDTEPEPTPARARRFRDVLTDRPALRPAYRTSEWRSPRRALAESWAGLPPHLRWLAYRGTAAYAGWELGLVDYTTHVTAWIAHNGTTSGQAWFWYTAAACTVLLYRRTSRLALPIAWAATIPVASTVTGVLLYAPGI